jgi:outer membrane protein, multidrug efflux system
MKHYSALLLAFVSATFTGCALNPLPSSERVLADSLPENTRIPEQWHSPNIAGSVSNGWLASFNDPALEAIVAEALKNNPDLRISAERVRIAQQQVTIVGAQLKPQIGAVAGERITYDDGSDDANNATSAYLGVAWEADVWGRIRAQRDAAEATANATAMDYAFARQSLVATVAKAWYLASETQQLAALADQSIKVYGEQLRLSSLRAKAGKDSNLGVADTQAKLNNAKASYEDALARHQTVQRALEVLLGRYPAAEIAALDAFKPLPAPSDSGNPISLLQRRPDLVAAEQNVFAAFRMEESARLALLPDFSLDMDLGKFSNSVLSLLQLNPWLATANIGMVLPVYEGGALRAKIEIANAKQAIALERYAITTLNAFKEVENALADVSLQQKQLGFEMRAMTDNSEAVRIATAQFLAGRQDLMWVTTFQQNLIASQIAVIQLQSAQRINRIQLNLALGRSFDDMPATTVSSLHAMPSAGF